MLVKLRNNVLLNINRGRFSSMHYLTRRNELFPNIKSIKQAIQKMVRSRGIYVFRRPFVSPSNGIANHGRVQLREVSLRNQVHPQTNVTQQNSLFSPGIRDFVRGLLSLTPAAVYRMTNVVTLARRGIVLFPGRTVAPLLGLIAAFLQESRTEQFQSEVACVAVRAEANEYSKETLQEVKPRFDLSSFRSVADLEFGNPLGKGCNAAVYEARLKEACQNKEHYDLAVKVLFNFSLHSDAESVHQLFEPELLPSRINHLNIIDVFRACVDEVPSLPKSDVLFPNALPAKQNPAGYARSQTMFLLMNKFKCTLRDHVEKYGSYSLEEGLAVFAQLLEAVVKMGKENIVHRDIKSDNILLAKSQDENTERAVISDFGCSHNSLRMYFPIAQVSRGGNRALMPPEVINAEAGILKFIDYSRADLWSVGTIAYEIFAEYNPFFEGPKLNSATYEEEALPEVVPDHTPLNNLVHALLRRNHHKRPHPNVAGTACHLLLWGFPLDDPVPTMEVIRCWIMGLCVKLICTYRDQPTKRALLATFLKRCSIAEILQASKLLAGII